MGNQSKFGRKKPKPKQKENYIPVLVWHRGRELGNTEVQEM